MTQMGQHYEIKYELTDEDYVSLVSTALLLPCPFCGQPPVVYPLNPQEEGNWAVVACVNAYCPAQPEVENGDDVDDECGWDVYKQSAIARWNRRRV